MHKIPSGARFIIAGKKCINKQLSKHVTSALKLCYSQTDAYHKKTYYFSGANTFWVIQNNSLPLECIKKINKRKNAKQISTFHFSTLYTKIPHDKLLHVSYKIGTRDYIIINKQGCASWSSKERGHHFVFAKSLLKEAIKFLLHNCFFSIGNIAMIQVIGIPMGSDPAPFLANLFLAQKEADLVKAQRELGTINVQKINNSFRFIDDLLSLYFSTCIFVYFHICKFSLIKMIQRHQEVFIKYNKSIEELLQAIGFSQYK